MVGRVGFDFVKAAKTGNTARSSVGTFLNRLLGLRLSQQNALFEVFAKLVDHAVPRRRPSFRRRGPPAHAIASPARAEPLRGAAGSRRGARGLLGLAIDAAPHRSTTQVRARRGRVPRPSRRSTGAAWRSRTRRSWSRRRTTSPRSSIYVEVDRGITVR